MTTTPATAYQPTDLTKVTEDRPPTRSKSDDARAVLAALRSDWIKASTVRANRALLLLTIAGGLLVSWAVSVLVTDQVQYVAQVGFFWTSVTSMLAAIGGVLLFGSEVQHGTLASAVAARPARWVLALSKTLTAAVLGLVLGALGLAAGFGGAVIAGLDAGDTSSLIGTIGWALLFTTLSGVLGLGIAMIVRNSTAAIGGFLVWDSSSKTSSGCSSPRRSRASCPSWRATTCWPTPTTSNHPMRSPSPSPAPRTPSPSVRTRPSPSWWAPCCSIGATPTEPDRRRQQHPTPPIPAGPRPSRPAPYPPKGIP